MNAAITAEICGINGSREVTSKDVWVGGPVCSASCSLRENAIKLLLLLLLLDNEALGEMKKENWEADMISLLLMRSELVPVLVFWFGSAFTRHLVSASTCFLSNSPIRCVVQQNIEQEGDRDGYMKGGGESESEILAPPPPSAPSPSPAVSFSYPSLPHSHFADVGTSAC